MVIYLMILPSLTPHWANPSMASSELSPQWSTVSHLRSSSIQFLFAHWKCVPQELYFLKSVKEKWKEIFNFENNMTLLHQFKTEQIITVLSMFTWTNQWWLKWIQYFWKTFEKVILDTTMHWCLKQFWTDIKN